tara:strand:+ start:57 stop:233 length:177 start_codon:yes stop_codon:yes gene_type:complete
MNSLPEEFFEELNELLKVEALDELERDLEEVDVITDHLPNPDEEAEYWEMKAEVHFGI